MARIRTLKPEFWTDELLGQLEPIARLFYIGLISHADDEGRFRADPRLLRAQMFVYHPKITNATVEDLVNSLWFMERIYLYEVGGQRYGVIRKFKQHQKIDKPSPSKIPPPTDFQFDEPSANPRRALAVGLEGNGREGKGSGEKTPGAASESGLLGPSSAAGTRGRGGPPSRTSTSSGSFQSYADERAAWKAAHPGSTDQDFITSRLRAGG